MISNASPASLAVLGALRPPFARSATLLFPFTGEGSVNNGITVQTQPGEPAVAPGDGQVRAVYQDMPQWQSAGGVLSGVGVVAVVIDHGNKVLTTVSGLRASGVTQGQRVARGDSLGALYTNQLFVAVSVGGKPLNPVAVNSHWAPQNSNVVAGQSGVVRFAPDRLARDLSGGVRALLHGAIHYFSPPVPAPLLVSVAFNGDGGKTGPAAAGIGPSDWWNVYTPVSFTAAAALSCYLSPYTGAIFSGPVIFTLEDYAARRAPVFLERVAPQSSAAGSAASWDGMLKRWIGGYTGPTPFNSVFRLRGLPAGSYNLYLYASQGAVPLASRFYASVNSGTALEKGNNPSGTASFVENDNYVVYPLAVPAGGSVTFTVFGYLSGLQIERV